MFVLETSIIVLAFLGRFGVHGLKYEAQYEGHNLNENQDATDPLDYSGTWDGHTYTPSPDNWRVPFYTLFLDRYANGDPTNDNANGTVFEQEVMGTQLRFGGDVMGLRDSLDYIQGFGIKAIYIAGSPFINQPWAADSYSPLDHTLLDLHFGNITEWRAAIADIHSRGMYVILDNTLATMGDLIGFKGYLNESAPFTPEHEHESLWKTSRRYNDFTFGTEYNETCDLPIFWLDSGEQVEQSVYDEFDGCYNGDFDQVCSPDRLLVLSWAHLTFSSSMVIRRLLVYTRIGDVKSQSLLRSKIDFENGARLCSKRFPTSHALRLRCSTSTDTDTTRPLRSRWMPKRHSRPICGLAPKHWARTTFSSLVKLLAVTRSEQSILVSDLEKLLLALRWCCVWCANFTVHPPRSWSHTNSVLQ